MPPSAPKPPSDDAAMRKKKNADAQAAFRARRANYIATLEEAVTNLESVVLQLQESCREAKTESAELRKENNRLRHTTREREKFWRTLWQQSRKNGGHSDSPQDDYPPHLQSSYPPSNGAPLASPISPSHVNQYGDQSMSARYPSRDPSGSMSNNNGFNPGAGHEYPNRSPTITFAGTDPEHGSLDGRSNPLHSQQRAPKYAAYSPYDVEGGVREHAWSQNMTQASMTGGDPMQQDGASSSHSPSFVEAASNLTSPEMSYVPRYPVDDQKMSLTNLDTNAPYVFSQSRPLSPSASTTSSASSTMTSPFQFPFPDGSVTHQDRPDFNFRRQSTGAGAELTLHGGTAHISLMGQNDRYRLPSVRRNMNTNDNQSFPMVPPLGPETPSHERTDGEGDGSYYHGSQPAVRRSTTTSRTSRSPSPGTPPICGTLAVIKAQAFGALRRTRTRTKKGSEGAAKAAMEALEARGIGMGMSVPKSNKRPRLDDDDDDDDADFRP